MKKQPDRWKLAVFPAGIAVVFVAFVFCWLWTSPFTHCPLGLSPARFEFSEHRYTDGSAEEAALAAAETFNYSLLPARTAYAFNATYISRNRLDGYATIQAQFNPSTHCGQERFVYTANVSWHTRLNVTLDWEWYPLNWSRELGSPLQVDSNGTLLFPYKFTVGLFSEWSAAYWNGTGYETLDQPIVLNLTDVFLVDMQLSYSYTYAPAMTWRSLECQEVVADASNRVLFAFWLKLISFIG